jgi:hypothetical protein
LSQNMGQPKMQSADGKYYLTDIQSLRPKRATRMGCPFWSVPFPIATFQWDENKKYDIDIKFIFQVG